MLQTLAVRLATLRLNSCFILAFVLQLTLRWLAPLPGGFSLLLIEESGFCMANCRIIGRILFGISNCFLLEAKGTLDFLNSMAPLFTSFSHGLLEWFFARSIVEYGEKLAPLYLAPNKKLSSENGEISYRSSQDTYSQRKKNQVTSSYVKDAIIS